MWKVSSKMTFKADTRMSKRWEAFQKSKRFQLELKKLSETKLIKIYSKIEYELCSHEIPVHSLDIQGFHQACFWIQALIKKEIESEKE